MSPFTRALSAQRCQSELHFQGRNAKAFGLGNAEDHAAWAEAVNILRNFDDCMEHFLVLFTEYMKTSGYLAFTTNKREDCIQAARYLLEPILEHENRRQYPHFYRLIGNIDGWADDLVEAGLRHKRRGTNVAMFLGGFKTFSWAMQDALDSLAQGDNARMAKDLLALYGHAFEVLWMGMVVPGSPINSTQDYEAVARQLALEKCRFENAFNAVSDGVLVMDLNCRIIYLNATLRGYAGKNLCGAYIWAALGLDGISCKEALFDAFPLGTQFEAPLWGGDMVFRISIISMGHVSMTDRYEYLACLTNITNVVRQRNLLKVEVDKRTAELLHEKKGLEEMNITLRNVIKCVNEEREKSFDEASQQIRRFIFPAVRKVATENDLEARYAYMHLLTEQLERFLSPARGSMDKMCSENPEDQSAPLGRLTLTELKVCQLVQAGHSSKKIADLLNISLETVKTHRRSIRRKLNLRGNESHLGALLLSQQF